VRAGDLDLDAVSLLELHARADEINLKLVDLSRLEHFGLLETVAVAGAHDALGHVVRHCRPSNSSHGNWAEIRSATAAVRLPEMSGLTLMSPHPIGVQVPQLGALRDSQHRATCTRELYRHRIPVAKCVQRRLACSVGDRPTGVRVRAP